MINFAKTIYHNIKIEIISSPNLFFKPTVIDEKEKKKFNLLKKNQFLLLKNQLNENLILKANSLISKKIEDKNSIFIEKQRVWKISFIDDFEFLLNELVSQKLIDQICNYFQRKKIFIADIDIRRVLPVNNIDIPNLGMTNNAWHKDIRGRQLKLMVYLSDVGKEDNYFSFIPNTSNSRTYNFKKSRFKDDEINTNNEFCFTGNKGDAMLFNTNLTHRLNRKQNARIRDSITIYFTPGQYVSNIFKNKEKIKKIKHNIQNLLKF